MKKRKKVDKPAKTALYGVDEVGINQLLLCLSSIPDPRAANVSHALPNILIMMLVAMAGGADHVLAVYEFCEGHFDFFQRIFCIQEVPSVHTFYRVTCLLQPAMLEEAMRVWIQNWREAAPNSVPEVVSIDGKAMNGYKGSYLNVVSAVSSRNGLILSGMETKGAKRNEQSAMVRLIDALALKDAIITSDAMGTQVTVVDAICAAGADYVLPVKENQHNTLEAVKLCFDKPFTEVERQQSTEKQGGRLEERVYEFVKLGQKFNIPDLDKWQGLLSVGKSTATTTNIKTGEVSVDIHFYISSVDNLRDFAMAARSHWGVESMHWMLDVVFREDNCMMHDATAQKNMNVLRKIILNAFRLDDPKCNVAGRRRRSGWNEKELLKTIRLLKNI